MAATMRECRSGRFGDGGWLDFGDTPPLTQAEERELGYRIQDGDLDARDHLVRANLRIVAYVANGYRNRGVPYADLIGEGNLGLIRAAELFDPDEGTRFNTFAQHWIKQSITMALDIQTRAARVPKHAVTWLNRWRRRENELTRTLTRQPSRQEIIDSLGLTPRQLGYIEHAMIASRPSARVGGPRDTVTEDFVHDVVDQRPEAKSAVDEDLTDLSLLLDRLDEQERTIINLRFGLTSHQPMSGLEVGRHFGVARQRVSQVERRALLKMAV